MEPPIAHTTTIEPPITHTTTTELPIVPTTAIADGEQTDNAEMKQKHKKKKIGILKHAVSMFQPRPKTDQKKKKEKTKPSNLIKKVRSVSALYLEEDIRSPTLSVSLCASPTKEYGNMSEDNFICTPDASYPSTSLSSKKSGIRTINQQQSDINLQELDNPMTHYNSAIDLLEMDTPMSQYSSAVNLQELASPMSQYGSTNNLQDLEEVKEKDHDEVRISEDAMIDTKAEEFIAQFYEALRHEQSNRKHRPRIQMW